MLVGNMDGMTHHDVSYVLSLFIIVDFYPLKTNLHVGKICTFELIEEKMTVGAMKSQINHW